VTFVQVLADVMGTATLMGITFCAVAMVVVLALEDGRNKGHQ
jgi:hypothetical protein